MRKTPVIALLSMMLLVSCGSTSSEALSSSAEEVISSTSIGDDVYESNILEDDYRNYYEIFVYSFADSDGDGIGDLNGITAKLPYLRDIGYTGIWLTPIFKSNSYHKYDTIDYFEIAKDFGTLDDLKALVSKAHELGMKVILDGVFNHTSSYSKDYEKALIAHRKKLNNETLSEEESNYESLYVFVDNEEDKISGHKYSKAGANAFYYECNFADDMPELDFESEYTYTYIKSIIDYYMSDDIKVDGFRLDAVIYYDYNNTVSNVAILNKIAKMIHDHEGYVVGECWSNATTIAKYYQSDIDSFFWFPGQGSDGFMNKALGFQGTNKATYLAGMKNMIDSSSSHVPAPFLCNHDTPRMSKAGSSAATKFLLGLRDLSNGCSFNYYGEEIGMSSSEQPSNTNYLDASYRSHYYWDDETHEYETNNPPNGTVQKEYFPAAATQLKDNNSILNYQKKVLNLRNAFPLIARGEISVSSLDEEINASEDTCLLAFDKTYQNESMKFVYNFSSLENYEYDMNGYQIVSILRGDENNKETIKEGKITLPPYSIAVLKQ